MSESNIVVTIGNIAADVTKVFLGVTLAALYLWLLFKNRQAWRFGGWKWLVVAGKTALAEQRIGLKKVQALLDDPEEAAEYFRRVASAFCEKLERVLVTEDRAKQRFVIDVSEAGLRHKPEAKDA